MQVDEMLDNIKETYENKVFRLETTIRNKDNYIKEITKEMTQKEIKVQAYKNAIEKALEELNKSGFITGQNKSQRAKEILLEVMKL